MSVPAGHAADRRGPVRVLALGVGAFGVAYVVFALTGPAIALLAVAFVLAGVGIGLVETAEARDAGDFAGDGVRDLADSPLEVVGQRAHSRDERRHDQRHGRGDGDDEHGDRHDGSESARQPVCSSRPASGVRGRRAGRRRRPAAAPASRAAPATMSRHRRADAEQLPGGRSRGCQPTSPRRRRHQPQRAAAMTPAAAAPTITPSRPRRWREAHHWTLRPCARPS